MARAANVGVSVFGVDVEMFFDALLPSTTRSTTTFLTEIEEAGKTFPRTTCKPRNNTASPQPSFSNQLRFTMKAMLIMVIMTRM